MVGGGAQTLTGAEEVGAADTGVGEKISICPYVGYILHCGVKGGYFIWVGDVGYATAHREDLGRIPPQGGLHIDREATTEGFVWDMVVPPRWWWRCWSPAYKRWRPTSPDVRTQLHSTL